MKKKVYWITISVILVLFVIIAFQNLRPVHISLLFYQGEFPGAVLALAVFILGFLAGLFTAMRKKR